MYLIFDTETTGLPKRWDAPITDTDNWPRAIQIAWQLHDAMGNCIEHQDYLIQPEGFNIPYDAEKIHGISTELAQEQGVTQIKVDDYSARKIQEEQLVWFAKIEHENESKGTADKGSIEKSKTKEPIKGLRTKIYITVSGMQQGHSIE